MAIQNTLLSHIMKFHIIAVLTVTLCHMIWFRMYSESRVSQTLDITEWKIGMAVLSDTYSNIWSQIYVLSHSLNLSDFNAGIDEWEKIEFPKEYYTGCNRRNGPDFGRVFLMLNYTEKPQNTYIQSWTVWEIMASEVWNFDSCYTLTDYQICIETGRNMWFL